MESATTRLTQSVAPNLQDYTAINHSFKTEDFFADQSGHEHGISRLWIDSYAAATG